MRPYDGKITLLSVIAPTEMYGSFAGPMLGDLNTLVEEEAHLFMQELEQKVDYPNIDKLIFHGELGDGLLYARQQRSFDLVICGNHSGSLMNKISCSAKRFINTYCMDVLIVPL
jgi:universal stress protein C